LLLKQTAEPGEMWLGSALGSATTQD
jgi:hypothetical protein